MTTASPPTPTSAPTSSRLRTRLNTETASAFEDDDGCPELDNDKDGILDAADACPGEAGVVENKGCADKDGDGDGVVDRSDNCPTEAGTADNYGCAKKQLVVLKAEKLEILDKVFFATAKDVIQSKSFPLLDNVAAVVNAHPEIKHIRVEGHTDNVGDAAKNKDLSNRRAAAVVKYLVSKGVAADRLVSEGFGQEKPIADNATTEGKANNRRVEFVLVN
jgi:OmpA-OmpF porin, OOP family